MTGCRRGFAAAWLLTCSTTPDIYGTGQPARERSQGSQPTSQKRGFLHASKISMMLRLVLNLPTASLRDAKMGDILACFPCRSRIFPLIGRNCGQRLKTEDLRGCGEDGPGLHCPKTGAVDKSKAQIVVSCSCAGSSRAGLRRRRECRIRLRTGFGRQNKRSP